MKYGEYARTRNGMIFQVDEEKKNICMNDFMNMRGDRDIVNHSKAPKDLVQAGDILKIDENKYEVIYDESFNKLGILIPNRNKLAIRHSSLEFIFQECKNIEILTKEQYKQNCFEVVE